MRGQLGKRKIQVASALILMILMFSFLGTAQEQIVSLHIPMLLYLDRQKEADTPGEYLVEGVFRSVPLYQYLQDSFAYPVTVEDESTYEMILHNLEDLEAGITKEAEEDGISLTEGDVGKALEEENESAKLLGVEEENANSKFAEAKEKQAELNMAEMGDFKTLISHFYAIDSTTTIDAAQLNVDTMLGKDMKLLAAADKPQILIYHTHASEGFVDSVPGETSQTIVGAGEKLAGLLRDQYGYNVIHDTGVYDTVRAQAYSVAAPNVEKILADNPSIEVVIDLHRDQVKEGTKLLSELSGRPTAKFMFFNGLSRTKEHGNIEYLPNPYIDDNLALAFQMQLACSEYYPGITRRIYLKGYRYNMHYRAKSLLIELGAQTNTVEEILNAIDPIAHILDLVLSGEAP